MTTLREVAQQALEALCRCTPEQRTASDALRAALAQQEQATVKEFLPVEQPEQEPVAWSPLLTYPNYEKERVWLNGKPRQEDVEYWSKNGNGITYVYNHPPRREWKSLTEEEIQSVIQLEKEKRFQQRPPLPLSMTELSHAIEAALKEKNNE